MTSRKDDGGPAFPTARVKNKRLFNKYGEGYEKAMVFDDEGMSLRDWFAGMALQGTLASTANPASDGWANRQNEVAEVAYLFADAMLKARQQ